MLIACYRSVTATMTVVSAMTSVLACRHRSPPVAPMASPTAEGPRTGVSQVPSLWVQTDDSIYSFRRGRSQVDLDIGISYTNRGFGTNLCGHVPQGATSAGASASGR